MKRGFCDSGLFIVLFLLDRITKGIALSALHFGSSVHLFSFFGVHYQLTLTSNEGAAWGSLTEWKDLLFYIRLIFVIVLLVAYFWFCTSSLVKTALIVIVAGACGNIVDTILWGHVVDMIHVTFWGWDYPVFNMADVYISLGCAFVFLSTFFTRKS